MNTSAARRRRAYASAAAPSGATGAIRSPAATAANEGCGGAPLPDPPPRLLDLGLRLTHVAPVVGLVHLAGLCGEWLQVQPIVGLDHDLQRLTHRGRPVVLLDRPLGALGGGDVRAALEGGERLARRAGRALREVGAEQMLDHVRRALEVHQSLDVPGVVHARMGGILADEGLGRVGRGLAFPGAVICVDEIEPRLARLVGERKARRQLLVRLDGGVEVVRIEAVPGALVEHVGGLLLLIALAVRAAAGDGEYDDTQGDHAAAYRTGQEHLEGAFLWLRAA